MDKSTGRCVCSSATPHVTDPDGLPSSREATAQPGTRYRVASRPSQVGESATLDTHECCHGNAAEVGVDVQMTTPGPPTTSAERADSEQCLRDAGGVEEVVAVELTTASGDVRYVVTWGRIQHRTESEPLEVIALANAGKFGVTAIAARVCHSLQDARDAPYFFEALIHFSAGIASRDADGDLREWERRTDSEMRAGRHLCYLGDPT